MHAVQIALWDGVTKADVRSRALEMERKALRQ